MHRETLPVSTLFIRPFRGEQQSLVSGASANVAPSASVGARRGEELRSDGKNWTLSSPPSLCVLSAASLPLSLFPSPSLPPRLLSPFRSMTSPDPWARADTWRRTAGITRNANARRMLPGFLIGSGLFVAAVAIETAFGGSKH